jgi:hypothetical protein
MHGCPNLDELKKIKVSVFPIKILTSYNIVGR